MSVAGGVHRTAGSTIVPGGGAQDRPQIVDGRKFFGVRPVVIDFEAGEVGAGRVEGKAGGSAYAPLEP